MIKNIIKAFGIASLTIVLLGCESKIVSPSKTDPMLTISIDMADASPKLLAAVDQYKVIVVDPATSVILADSPLTLDNNGNIVGQLDSLPTAIELEFTAQAFDVQIGLIFSGTTNAVLEPEVVNNVVINLSPVVPLIKCTPRYNTIAGSDTSSHTVDIKIFNVDSLYGISFRVRYDSNYLAIVNAKLDSSQNPAQVIFFQFDSVDANGPYKAIALSGITPGTAIVNGNGDAVLVNVSFVLKRPFAQADSTLILLEPTGMTHANQSNIPTSILFEDETVVIISPGTPVPPRPAPPQCPMALLEDIEIEGEPGERVSTIILWTPNNDPVIAGYNVYRNIGAGFERINVSLITTNPLDPELPNVLFLDSLVDTLSQNQYEYFVTAVDIDNNESAPSDPMRFVPSQVWNGYAFDSIVITSPQNESYIRSLSNLSWFPVTVAESYLIVFNQFVSANEDNSIWAIRSSKSDVSLGDTDGCTYLPFTFAPLLANIEYGFEVYGVNADNAVFINGMSHFVFVPDPISGITETDDSGNVISVDPDDWCPANLGPGIPQNFSVYPAYPNPTDSGVVIRLAIPQISNVCVRIINDSLELVRTLLCETLHAGIHEVVWDATNDSGLKVSPGIYRCYVEIDYDFVLCHGDIMVTDPPQQTPVNISSGVISGTQN